MEKRKIINDYEMNIIIADNIIKTIESGNVSLWQQLWQMPLNQDDLYFRVIAGDLSADIFRQKAISNVIYGFETPMEAGFYLTFNDIKDHGLKLKKGSKGVPFYKFTMFEKFLTKLESETLKNLIENVDKIEDLTLKAQIEAIIEDPEEKHLITFEVKGKEKSYQFNEIVYKVGNVWKYQKKQYVLFYYFNNKDLENPIDVKNLWNVKETKEKKDNIERNETAEQVKNAYVEYAKVDYKEQLQNEAYYMPYKHAVRMPLISEFKETNDFYQVAFHELSHSTMKFLRPREMGKNYGFGSKEYSKEELVAELSSLYILNALGLTTEKILQNSIAYLKSWGENLTKGIKHNILNTISKSQEASNLIIFLDAKGLK